jgi:pyruvate/oxaloacetate carboxyltransferase
LRELKTRSFGKIANETIYDIKLGTEYDNVQLMNMLPKLKKIFQEVLKEVKPSKTKDTDLVRIYIDYDDLTVPITISPVQWSKLDENIIVDKLEHVLSSKQTLRADIGFQIPVASIAVSKSRTFRVICQA